MSRGEPTLAIIGHLESFEAYRSALNAARGADLTPLDVTEVESVVRHLDPAPLCDFVLRSSRGTTAMARYIDLGLVVDGTWSFGRDAVSRVRRACAEARSTGARLGTLGGFSSIVGETAKVDLDGEFGLPFTTGNTLTAAVLAEQVATEAGGGRPLVAVVGAGGDVSTGLCRLLHARGIPLLLVGRSPRPLERLAAELPGTHVMDSAEALAKAEMVVLVASAPFGTITLDGLRPGARVLDAGHPPNARPVRGIAYAAAGRVSYALPPESDLPVILTDRYPPGESHACLAEGIVLALEGRFEAFSSGRGHIRADRAAEILALAARHGVRPASLHFQS